MQPTQTGSHQSPEPFPVVDPDDLRKTHAEKVIFELRRASMAAFDLLAELTAARSDGDEWTRLPRKKERCPVTFFSRSKIERLIVEDKIRAKTSQGGRYYSLADCRALLRQTTPNN